MLYLCTQSNCCVWCPSLSSRPPALAADNSRQDPQQLSSAAKTLTTYRHCLSFFIHRNFTLISLYYAVLPLLSVMDVELMELKTSCSYIMKLLLFCNNPALRRGPSPGPFASLVSAAKRINCPLNVKCKMFGVKVRHVKYSIKLRSH